MPARERGLRYTDSHLQTDADQFMKLKSLLSLGVLFCLCVPAPGAVRILFKDGKRIIYNDGVGEATHEALRKSDDWLARRIALPSLYDDLISQAARGTTVDPRLVKSVMLIESAFNASAVSPKGAQGLMQLMPATAAQLGVRDAFDPGQNIQGGTRHLAYLLHLFGGNLENSLAAYNAGENAVLRYGGIPPYAETRLYVRKALTAYHGRGSLEGGFGRSSGTTWRAARGRPVRLQRDSRNRVLLTTAPSPLRRLG